MQKSAKSINDIFNHSEPQNRMSRMIRCEVTDAGQALGRFSSEMYIDATTIILVTDGCMELEINRISKHIEACSAVLLASTHLLRMAGCSADFRAVVLLVGEEFMSETDSVDMIYKRIRYGIKLYDKPVVKLTPEGARLIGSRLDELQRAIADSRHLYYRDVVLNRLFAFYLDLSDIIDRREELTTVSEHTARYESVVKRFIELLIANYRAEHTVGFYASRLNISAHYLTSIMKEVTGRSVSDFIFGMLYSDARALLDDSRLSIQEITALLNFSDQSAFGKFFKRRSGVSPLDYRKKRN